MGEDCTNIVHTQEKEALSPVCVLGDRKGKINGIIAKKREGEGNRPCAIKSSLPFPVVGRVVEAAGGRGEREESPWEG